MVEVFTHTYNEIFKNYKNVSVPEYQRPYRWTTEKVDELLMDLEEFFITKPNPNLEYYMGGILFFQDTKEKKSQIIDGQQRLTTLTLIQYMLEGELQSNQNLAYNNHISFYNIKKNLTYLEEKRPLLDKLNNLKFFNRLRFTLILSDNEDNAFAFFDSQNNRGVTLGADDFLKAYHLREVHSEHLQEHLAQEWERTVFNSQKEKNFETGLQHLFYKILYRARKWRGQSQLIPEDKDILLKTFQKETLKSPNDDVYELFPGRVNQRFKFLFPKDDNTSEFLGEEMENQKLLDLPFAVRQPIFKGHNFFKFTQKYHDIHQHLFSEASATEISVVKAREYYYAIYTDNMSVYLRHYMQLCMVMYYDTFGDAKIDEAVKYFDYLLGSIRIEKYYVKKEAVKNSLIDNTNNLLDVIANAYIPQEVFDFVMLQPKAKSIYDNENLDNDNGVRNAYKNRVLSYFNQSKKTLKERLEWI
jgi:hypothetical protein